jgi:hypothetical protein
MKFLFALLRPICSLRARDGAAVVELTLGLFKTFVFEWDYVGDNCNAKRQ